MPASSEFITLCQTQIALLVDGFGASLGAIYLTDDPMAEGAATLIPLVIYPDVDTPWAGTLALPAGAPWADATALPTPSIEAADPLKIQHKDTEKAEASRTQLARLDVLKSTRMVLPLVHEEMMWGLLVVDRDRRRWRKREQTQLEQIAHTLAIACVLDQRSQWLAQGREQRLFLQTQQHTTLSTLLHQFRNPLTTLRTLGKLLLKRLNPTDINRELVKSMVDESTHLETLLRQFDDAIDLGDAALEPTLDSEEYSLVQPAALPPAPPWLNGGALTLQPCWVSDILLPLLHAIAGRLDEQTLQLHCSIPDGLPPIKADPAALREVLGNLIDNALKYTPAGGEIWVAVHREAGQQHIAIRDSGCGIPDADLLHIFERRYRGVQAQTNIPGTGLGLAIARDLLQSMGGSIEVRSMVNSIQGSADSLSKGGSTFVVQLPEYAG